MPWLLEEIWNGAICGLDTAYERRDELGLEFQTFAWECIIVGARKAADEIRMETGPTEDRIRAAIAVFSADQWIHIITKFEREDREVLRKFILANLPNLEQNRGRSKLRAIRGAIGRHAARTVLQGANPRGWICVTDAHYAMVLHDLARYHKMQLDPPPPGGRSWDELAGPSAIAEKLGISRYRAKNMLKRMQEKSLDEFIAEHGGTFLDYWRWATDPKAHERYRKAGRI